MRCNRGWNCLVAETAKKQERPADLKTAPEPENRNHNRLRPISGQGSALWHMTFLTTGSSLSLLEGTDKERFNETVQKVLLMLNVQNKLYDSQRGKTA